MYAIRSYYARIGPRRRPQCLAGGRQVDEELQRRQCMELHAEQQTADELQASDDVQHGVTFVFNHPVGLVSQTTGK